MPSKSPSHAPSEALVPTDFYQPPFREETTTANHLINEHQEYTVPMWNSLRRRKKYSVGYSHTDKQTNPSHSSVPIEFSISKYSFQLTDLNRR